MPALEKFLERLKSKTILDRKPNLKICLNHLKDTNVSKGRTWVAPIHGQAFCDGHGWFVPSQRFKRKRRGKRRKRFVAQPDNT